MLAAEVKAHIEKAIPTAFTVYRREFRGSIPTGIRQIDNVTGGVPLHALTEVCGSSTASSGKTSVLVSLLAQASQKHSCTLIDATDSFDPASGQAAGIDLSKLLWVRCGKRKTKLPRLEQAFKAADILLQSTGFGLIAVDVSGIAESIVRKVPLSTWFRFSRVIEKQSAALVFIEQEPHATSCAGLVLRIGAEVPLFQGNLFTQVELKAEVVRAQKKKPVSGERSGLSLHTQWA